MAIKPLRTKNYYKNFEKLSTMTKLSARTLNSYNYYKTILLKQNKYSKSCKESLLEKKQVYSETILRSKNRWELILFNYLFYT